MFYTPRRATISLKPLSAARASALSRWIYCTFSVLTGAAIAAHCPRRWPPEIVCTARPRGQSL
ncbi:MAG: hypothetical protein AAGF32_05770, partial [Pseudomonadota bacterium]